MKFRTASSWIFFVSQIFWVDRVLADSALDHFERRIRPLLMEHCYECHSTGQKTKAGLSLDHRLGWQNGGDSGPAIVAHSPDASLLMRAVSYQDRDLKMPPQKKLKPAELEALRQWIADGATDPREGVEAPSPASSVVSTEPGSSAWWSFQPLKASPVPEVKQGDWPREAVDFFLLAELEKRQLSPNGDAPPPALLRRLSFDLTGLPPSAEVLRQFVRQPERYEAIVDELLASPAFAERWAQHWLDMTRFAESSGGGRTLPFKDAWRFRDYVIESIRQDVPLNQMIVEHLAGDLLPHDDDQQRARQLTATAFLALGPTNYEEQDKGLLRMDIIDEQLDTIGRSFMGMTIGCARCHDHKFDPISTRDYYAMAGIFRSTHTLRNYSDNVAHWVDLPLPADTATEAALARHDSEAAALRTQLAEVTQRVKALQPSGTSSPAQKGKSLSKDALPGLVMDETEATLVGPWVTSKFFPSFIGQGYIHDARTNKGSCTATFTPKVTESGTYEVRIAYTHSPSRATAVPIHILHAEGEEEIFIDQTQPPTIAGRFVSLGSYRFEKDGAGFILVSNEGTEGHVTLDAVWLVSQQQLDQPSPERIPQGSAAHDKALQEQEALQKAIQQHAKKGPQRPETMGVREDPKPADCPIHIRGNIRNLGATVPRGIIESASIPGLPAIPENQSGRLQLAQWMTHPQHPLTSRVLVNRIWMHLFGEGLVRSVDLFGTTGEMPSHPQLLDSLALQWMEEGWSLKKLVRRLVLTRAYQLSSLPRDSKHWQTGHTVDPENRLLWRAHRRRLDAHAIRDAILLGSADLDRRYLGPNVQVGSVDSNSGAAQNLEYDYQFTDTRRSLYIPAFRNKRHEIFEVFDYADINNPIGQRTRSTIAPQALYFLNHPFILQQSRLAAQHLLATESFGDDVERINHLWLSLLGRLPLANELRQAQEFGQGSPPDDSQGREQDFAQLIQALFASPDFRYLD